MEPASADSDTTGMATLQGSHDTWSNNNRNTDEDGNLQQDGKEEGGGRW